MACRTVSVLFTVVFLGCLAVSSAGEYCTKSYSNSWKTHITYCKYGCCGTYPDEYCCNLAAGAVVGIVFAVIVVACIVAAIVYCIKKQGASGRVVAPAQGVNNGPSVTVVQSNSTSGQYAAGGYNYPMQPVQPPPYYPAPAAGPSNMFSAQTVVTSK